jgi:hypothetical protein
MQIIHITHAGDAPACGFNMYDMIYMISHNACRSYILDTQATHQHAGMSGGLRLHVDVELSPPVHQQRTSLAHLCVCVRARVYVRVYVCV